MSDELTLSEIEKLKSRFRSVGHTVRDLKGFAFEIVSDDFPVRTHVYANPYYLQLGTQILAKPKQDFSIEKIREFLCDINLSASLVKFTMDTDTPDKGTGAWPILASTKLVTGVKGGDYNKSALNNLAMLWLQDIANLMTSASDFEIHPMMDIEKLSED